MPLCTDFGSDYSGNYILKSAMGVGNQQQLLQFLGGEDVTVIMRAKKILLTAEDFHKLEKRYVIPCPAKDVEEILKRFLRQDGKEVTVTNHNMAFGPNFNRTLKLLRDNGISYTCHVDGHVSNGDELNEGTITLTPGGLVKLKTDYHQILTKEKERHREHQNNLGAFTHPCM